MKSAGVFALWIAGFVGVAFVVLLPRGSSQDFSSTLLPEEHLASALRALPIQTKQPTIGYLATSSTHEAQPQPLVLTDRFLILFQPDLTAPQLAAFLADHELNVYDVYSEIGSVLAGPMAIDTSDQTLAAPSQLDELEIARLQDEIRDDIRIVAVIWDATLSSAQVDGCREMAPTPAGEEMGWGIRDTRIHELWPRLVAPIEVGVIDTGFRSHFDLALAVSAATESSNSDHGTRVAGVLCASHNGRGVMGALPNCTVHGTTAVSILGNGVAMPGNDEITISAFFSQHIAALLRFVNENPEIKTINASIGYRWVDKHRIHPDESQALRKLVTSQGVIAMALLEHLAVNKVVLVSAAGNDSVAGRKVHADWGSPFNFGASLMIREHGWSNGLVVESHDESGERASSSNVKGHLSCPGVCIPTVSAVRPDEVVLVRGTSFAAPHCAAAVEALRLLRPELKFEERLGCLTDGAGSTMRLDVAGVVRSCDASTPRHRRRSAVERISHESSFVTSDSFQTSECAASNREVFIISGVYDSGDGQGPEFVDQQSEALIARFFEELVSSGCNEPVFVFLSPNFYELRNGAMEFVDGIRATALRVRYGAEVIAVQRSNYLSTNRDRYRLDGVRIAVGRRAFDEELAATTQPQ